MKRVLSLLLLLAPALSGNLTFAEFSSQFSSADTLARQLFIDEQLARQYFSVWSGYPELPDSSLPVLEEMRLARSRMIIEIDRARRLQPRGILSRLLDRAQSFLGMSRYLSALEDAVDAQERLLELHNEFMLTNLSALLEDARDSQGLDYFRGKFESRLSLFELESPPAGAPIYLPLEYVAECDYASLLSVQGTLPFDPESCGLRRFYSRDGVLKFLEGVRGESLSRRLEWVTAFEEFQEKARMLVDMKERQASDAMDWLRAEQLRREELEAALSSPSVKEALSKMSPGSRLTSLSRAPPNSSSLQQLYTHALSLERLGDRAEALDSFLRGYEYFRRRYYEQVASIKGKLEAMEAFCEERGTDCDFSYLELPERLERTSQVFLLLWAELRGSEGDREAALSYALEELRSLLARLEPFLPSRDVLKFSAEIDRLELSPDEDGLRKLQDELVTTFLEKNMDRARSLKADLLTYSSLLAGKGENVTVADLPLHYNSPLSNFIYYLEGEELLTRWKELYGSMMAEYSAELPYNLSCAPSVPVTGEPFEVKCALAVHNGWGTTLERANVQFALPYPAKRLSSGNFMGNLPFLDSVSFSGGTVRLNLHNVPGLLTFRFSYSSSLPPVPASCSYLNDSTYSCLFSPACTFERVRVPLPHPFSGRRMNATAPYEFDGRRILVEVPCRDYRVNFTGTPYELVPAEGGTLVRNLINKTVWVHEVTPDVEVGVSLAPGEERLLPLALPPRDAPPETPSGNASAPPLPLSGERFQDFLTFLASGPPTFGCVEKNVYEAVREMQSAPRLRCFNLRRDEMQRLYESGRTEEAFRLYLNTTGDPRYQAFRRISASYRSKAEELLSRRSGGLFSRPYWKKAELAYERGDYIASIYYSLYAIKKSPISLGFDWRLLLALALIAYGIYSSRTGREEELI